MTRPAKLFAVILAGAVLSSCGREGTPTGPSGPTRTVKAWTKDARGHYVLARTMHDGDFFGEVSVLTGKPRTATITAATEVEVLELDKATLDGITQKYPRVRKVLEDFQKKRAQETVEAIIRSRD